MKEPEAHIEESRLVLRAQLGDRTALDELFRRTQDWLHGYLTRLLPNRHNADEVAQDVFLIIYRKLRFLHEPRVYRSWVYRIATRQAFGRLRRERKRKSVSGSEEVIDSAAASPPPESLDPEVIRQLRENVSLLPPNTRAVVVLHYFEHMTLRRIADVLDAPEGTVKSRLAYGLDRLRRQLGKEYE